MNLSSYLVHFYILLMLMTRRLPMFSVFLLPFLSALFVDPVFLHHSSLPHHIHTLIRVFSCTLHPYKTSSQYFSFGIEAVVSSWFFYSILFHVGFWFCIHFYTLLLFRYFKFSFRQSTSSNVASCFASMY